MSLEVEVEVEVEVEEEEEMREIRDLQRSIGPRLVWCPTAMPPVSERGLSSPQKGREVNCRTLANPPTYRTLLRIGKSALRNTLFSLALLCSLTMCCCSTLAQKRQQDRPVPIEPAAGEREARKLIEEILAQRPAEAPTNGVLRIFDADRKERAAFPIRMEILETKTNWTFTYEAMVGKGRAGDKLTIIHIPGKASRYLFTKSGETEARELSGNQTMIPFAGSDFWVADLGLEFLDWPRQRAVQREMRKFKSCVMLESVNPNPAPGGYTRVESWLTIDSPHAPVVAKAYDSTGKQLKEFSVDSVERVEGHYQLRSIEMRNLKARTRSLIEFDL